ncbi:MAG: Na(+)-translocating NADH-quinone reductase subunit C [Alphaproteobacteria bacterium]|nr:Na(+)-translocating NADH-quinone reductase subunit C [Alphaproteobacteria bacterium]
MSHSNAYIVGFAGAVCIICSIFVAGSAVALKDRQEANKVLDRQKNVLAVAGKLPDNATPDAVAQAFETNIRARVVDLQSGEYVEDVDPATFDQRSMRDDPATSHAAPAGNAAKVLRLPNEGLIYQVVDGDKVEMVILPVEGKGLWSTLYGFVALDDDMNTIQGLTFYEHAETPGLGGEVDNPRWKALWVGREVFDKSGEPAIEVIKGQAGPADSDPHRVDGLSGATLTSRGVSALMQFWMGDDGWGPYIDRMQKGGA